MRKINPLFVAAGLFFLIIIGIINMKNKSVEFDNSIVQSNDMTMIVNNYKDMKENWFDDKKIDTKINKILNDKYFKNTKINKIVLENSIKLNLRTSNKETLGVFIANIMNEKFEINKFEFSDSSVSFEIGVR